MVEGADRRLHRGEGLSLRSEERDNDGERELHCVSSSDLFVLCLLRSDFVSTSEDLFFSYRKIFLV